MKNKLIILMALSLFAAVMPAMADEGHQHGATHQTSDEQCAKECEMLLKNCAQEVDSIQERIRKLNVEIREKGTKVYTREELQVLQGKLKEAHEVLKNLEKPR